MKKWYRLNNVFMGLILGMVIINPLYAQEKVITLEEAIQIAQKNSFEYKVAANRYQSSVWNFRNYDVSFLPSLYLDGTIPNYSRSITKITLPTGEDAFVNQNQAFSSLNLGVRQNIGATGGVLSLSSTLDRIDILGDNSSVRYSTVPVSISYNQDAIGYNRFKWLKKTEPLRFEVSQKKLISDMEQIGLQSVSYYFNLFVAQSRRELSKQNLANSEKLYSISQERFKLGSVSQSELLQLRLNVLNAQKELTQDSVDLVLSRQQFLRYLTLPEDQPFALALPDSIPFFNVQFDDALKQAYDNSESVVQFRLDRIEAEQAIDRVKAESNLKFNIRANFGLSNRANSFPDLFNHLENQQNFALSFSLPLLDWRYSKTQKLRAEANLAMVENQVEQNEMKLEQEIALHTSRWNFHQQQLAIATETKEISERNYELEVERYLRGTITINDLNLAQSQKDGAIASYFSAIRTYWELYYTLRKLTLYDFDKKEKLAYTLEFN